MKKLFYLFVLLLSSYQIGQAQVELVPITENTVIQRYLGEQKAVGKQHTTIEKNACGNLEQPGVTYVQAARTVGIIIGIDTAGLGTGTYRSPPERSDLSARKHQYHPIQTGRYLIYWRFCFAGKKSGVWQYFKL